MTRKEQLARLAQVKLALAKKYEILARATGSRPRQKILSHHAETYRQQAAECARAASGSQ